jgi:hypothetical protein
MRHRRLLQEMAGLTAGAGERRARREARRAQRVAREVEERVLLVDRIRRREMGEDGLKPMPLSTGRRVAGLKGLRNG